MGSAVDEADGDAVVEAELAFEADLRLGLAHQLRHQGVHVGVDALDGAGVEAAVAKRRRRRRSGVGDDAAGVGLEAVVEDLPACRRGRRWRGRGSRAAEITSKTPRRPSRIALGRGEAVLRRAGPR